MESLNKDVVGCIMKWLPKLEQLRLPRLSKTMRRLCEEHARVVRGGLIGLYSAESIEQNAFTAAFNDDVEMYRYYKARVTLDGKRSRSILEWIIWAGSFDVVMVMVEEMRQKFPEERTKIDHALIKYCLINCADELLSEYHEELVAIRDTSDEVKEKFLICAARSGSFWFFRYVADVIGHFDVTLFLNVAFYFGYVHVIRWLMTSVPIDDDFSDSLQVLVSGAVMWLDPGASSIYRCKNPHRWEMMARIMSCRKNVLPAILAEAQLIMSPAELQIRGDRVKFNERIAGLRRYVDDLIAGRKSAEPTPPRECLCRGCNLINVDENAMVAEILETTR